ncbi:MAG: hypothetical protein ACYTGG_00910 [Planctomycetota bacterium]|jgi:hypothetical protein
MMKRRFLCIALFLLLGAVMNVGVAWGCALWVDPTGRDVPRIFLRVNGAGSLEVVKIEGTGAPSSW